MRSLAVVLVDCRLIVSASIVAFCTLQASLPSSSSLSFSSFSSFSSPFTTRLRMEKLRRHARTNNAFFRRIYTTDSKHEHLTLDDAISEARGRMECSIHRSRPWLPLDVPSP